MINNLPVILNEGASSIGFVLKGERLNLLARLEVAKGTAELAPASPGETERGVTIRIPPGETAGTTFATIKAFVDNRSQPLTFSDAVRVVGPKPRITGSRDFKASRAARGDR